ncbi:MAG: hypothetical protein M9891_09875 [Austwickia sp.]|nr:hypothetical protein [Actinomycetota bacterium]MCB1253819.1 hypothetical protein [Austwickia sp.]MCO5309582.1 hypothetical protein [Austwickia sp.]
MSDAPLPSLQVALSAAEQRGYHAVIVGEHALRIVGRFGDPTLGALELMVGADAPLGIQADGTEGHRSGLCLWTGPDLYAVTLGEGGRWEHFHVEQGLGVLRDSWRGGARGRYRVPHGPLVQPIPDAIALAESWGFATPETHQPQVHRPVPTRSAAPKAPRAAAPATPRSTTARATPKPKPAAASRPAEPVPRICPTCYMALPATGRCDFCA